MESYTEQSSAQYATEKSVTQHLIPLHKHQGYDPRKSLHTCQHSLPIWHPSTFKTSHTRQIQSTQFRYNRLHSNNNGNNHNTFRILHAPDVHSTRIRNTNLAILDIHINLHHKKSHMLQINKKCRFTHNFIYNNLHIK